MYIQLTDKERYSIDLLLQENYPQKCIAERLGRSDSTISREIKRNKVEGKYIPETAIELTKSRRLREHKSKFTGRAKNIITEKLEIGHSPKQIAVELKKENIFISHELIYQYIDKNRKTGGMLYKLMPRRGSKYKKRNIKNSRRVWKEAVKRNFISERPEVVSAKLEIGHWEGDTVESKGHKGGIGTFVDIKSKFVIIRKVNNKSSLEMKKAIINAFSRTPQIIKTLTVDNGTEFALHNEICQELKTEIYFTNPYSPWERGLNENTNGLIRRFYPKGTDFSVITDEEILRVQNLLNERPRETLGFKTPKEVLTSELLIKKEYQKII
jgi:IS30 family transposase